MLAMEQLSWQIAATFCTRSGRMRDQVVFAGMKYTYVHKRSDQPVSRPKGQVLGKTRRFWLAKDVWNRIIVASHQGLEQTNAAVMGYCNSSPFAQSQMGRVMRESGCNEFALGYSNDYLVATDLAIWTS